MSKKNKIIYTIAKVLFSIMMLIGVATYAFNFDIVATRFTGLGYPIYIILLLGVVKVLGLISIWFSKSRLLKEWTYAGFIFVLILGVIAHLAIHDNEYAPALISLILVATTYIFHRKEQVILDHSPKL